MLGIMKKFLMQRVKTSSETRLQMLIMDDQTVSNIKRQI